MRITILALLGVMIGLPCLKSDSMSSRGIPLRVRVGLNAAGVQGLADRQPQESRGGAGERSRKRFQPRPQSGQMKGVSDVRGARTGRDNITEGYRQNESRGNQNIPRYNVVGVADPGARSGSHNRQGSSIRLTAFCPCRKCCGRFSRPLRNLPSRGIATRLYPRGTRLTLTWPDGSRSTHRVISSGPSHLDMAFPRRPGERGFGEAHRRALAFGEKTVKVGRGR